MNRGHAPGRGGRVLYIATILTGSFLLFLVQPMVARMALPRLGGAPAVWNSAMLVYQLLLLGGYAYAHWLDRLAPRRQAVIHLVVMLVAAGWLPIGLIGRELPSSASPVIWAPWLLAASIGPLFFAVSAQAPLIQRWFNLASRGDDPYPLYAASNLGSFGGLIAYPLLVEPTLALTGQRWLWSAGYLVLIALVVGCSTMLPRAVPADLHDEPVSPRASRQRIAWWIALAAVPSGLMLATSTYITTDIVALPLLWVLPLGLYLLSFTVAFTERRGLADTLTRIAPILILLLGGVVLGGLNQNALVDTIIALVLLFVASVALHTRIYRLRPAPDRLTGFYLALAVGGALGGVFAGLIAPMVFDWTYEYPLLILAAGLLVPQVYLTRRVRTLWTDRARRRIALGLVAVAVAALFALYLAGPSEMFGAGHQGLAFIVIAGIGLVTLGARLPYMLVLVGAVMLFGGYRSLTLSFADDARARSYFGVYTIRHTPTMRELDHGTTVHGVQITGSPVRERTPTTYYVPGSGIGQAMEALPAFYGAHARVGVVGLGTGTLACYARPGQDWRFYEIDPAVVGIARDDFTYLTRCPPNPAIVIGDARLSLSHAPAASLDLLALDAFSSDAIPMHLMTEEAFGVYARVVRHDGLLLIHISNRFLDLEPVVAAAARAGGWRTAELDFRPSPLDRHATPSQWIALSRNANAIAALEALDSDWTPLAPDRQIRAWTDDYSSILPLLKWRMR
ncbi:spermidine synthase [Sphingomonas oligophenolica]|uniref:Spermidine synthase n=1 Tax=Sphingomonas oligophenolica TaxID=301154 RepID=A0A502C4K0_9SPHN|nr:fused MFS/spermidine synthase [Sphingomonas oligophenolica]TPG08475.1 hypothetical protein EAH84_13975 [Sphingomonas oligophenolica]